MKRCLLCERKINNTKYNYGIGCLKNICKSMDIDGIKNLNGETELDKRIIYLCNKEKLPKMQSSLLTNRYLTLKMLEEVKLNEYDKYKCLLKNDINKIEKSTKTKKLESYNLITLKQANEVNKQYKKYESFIQKMLNGDYYPLENITFDLIRFSFSRYYNNKPYLNDMTQKLQYYIWETLANAFKIGGFSFSANCLENSLTKSPKDMVITDGKTINTIKKDKNFINVIKNIIQEHEKESAFNKKTIISFNDGDLFLALHDATLKVNGKKESDKTWKLNIEVLDTYDFTDYKEIHEIISGNHSLLNRLGNVANNIAMISTSCNVMREYNIRIMFDMNNKEI